MILAVPTDLPDKMNNSPDNRIRVSADEKRLIDRVMMPVEVTRTSLAQYLKVSPAWVTKTITPLIERAVIGEVGTSLRSGGRRARILGLSPGLGYLLGVDFGVTSLSVALSTPDLEVLKEVRLSLDIRQGPEICLETLKAITSGILKENHLNPKKIRGIGMGVPGPVDFDTGQLISPPRMPGWDRFPLLEWIRAAYPTAVIRVDNDVNLMALGTLRQNSSHDFLNFILLKIGSGIGAGIVCQGQIYRGASGCAGDVGHIIVQPDGPLCHCGNRGCVEALAGGLAISRQAVQLAQCGESPILADLYENNQGQLSAADVGAAAAQGDIPALELIDQSGRYVGEMLTHLVTFFNPSSILIGGGVSHIGHRFINAIRQIILKQASPLATRDLRIEYSPLGDQAVLMGALSLAQQDLFYVPREST